MVPLHPLGGSILNNSSFRKDSSERVPGWSAGRFPEMGLEPKKQEEPLASHELTPSTDSPTILVLSDPHTHLRNRGSFRAEAQRGQGSPRPRLGRRGVGIRTWAFWTLSHTAALKRGLGRMKT